MPTKPRRKTVTIEGIRFPAGVEHVRTLEICGHRVPVIRATPKQVPGLTADDGAPILGLFIYETAHIVLRRGQGAHREGRTLKHEILHAFFYLSGLRQLLRSHSKRPKEWDDLEEAVIQIIEPHATALPL